VESLLLIPLLLLLLLLLLTYVGLLEGYGVGGGAQSVDGSHVDAVREAGEYLWEQYVDPVLMDQVLLHVQYTHVVSAERQVTIRML